MQMKTNLTLFGRAEAQVVTVRLWVEPSEYEQVWICLRSDFCFFLHVVLLARQVFPTGQGLVSGDQLGAALVGEVGPSPLDQHEYAIAESDEEEDVDG